MQLHIDFYSGHITQTIREMNFLFPVQPENPYIFPQLSAFAVTVIQYCLQAVDTTFFGVEPNADNIV